MQPAIAEKGLMVIDATARGKSGHAARGEGVNAIYEALDDICWLRGYKFEKVSQLLGPTVMNVTIINAGTQHNVIPDECRFTIDIRTNEFYRNEDVFSFLSSKMKSELKARSFRLSSSHISEGSPLIQRCKAMGMTPFGSPTLSDQALMPFPSFKLVRAVGTLTFCRRIHRHRRDRRCHKHIHQPARRSRHSARRSACGR